jgi:hypothetical protein
MADSKIEENLENEADELDVAIKDMLQICNEIQDLNCSKSKQQPHWSVCTNKLNSCYVQVNKPEGFRDMFITFHERYGDKYSGSILTQATEEDDYVTVNDDFFRDTDIYPTPGKSSVIKTSAPRRGSSWAKKPILKGPVMYYDYEKEKAAGVCIPIGEIYRVTIAMYDEMEKDGGDDADIRSLSARLLLSFFKLINVACEGKCDSSIQDNIALLEETISEVTSGEVKPSSGGPFGILKDVFKKILPTLTKGGKDSILPKGAQDALNSVIEGDTLDDVGSMFSEISGNIEKGAASASKQGGSKSVAAMMDTISDTLKSESVVSKIEGITNKLSQFSNGGILSPPTVIPKPIDSTPENDAGDQD